MIYPVIALSIEENKLVEVALDPEALLKYSVPEVVKLVVEALTATNLVIVEEAEVKLVVEALIATKLVVVLLVAVRLVTVEVPVLVVLAFKVLVLIAPYILEVVVELPIVYRLDVVA